MCEDCEEIEPLTVAYYGKVAGWRPPRQAASLPIHDDRLVTGRPYAIATFACDDAREKE